MLAIKQKTADGSTIYELIGSFHIAI